MTVEQGVTVEDKVKRRCILVGFQINGNGRELLHWALSKVAKKGNRVVALHVCRPSDLRNNSTQSLIKELDDHLAAYKDFCSLKQIVLVGKVSQGRSIKKALVKEVELCAAVTVVVGINQTSSLLGSNSVAKFCAKKLPPKTTLIAVHNGKVIFERGSSKPPAGEEPRPNLRSLLHPSIGMDAKVLSLKLSDVGFGNGMEEGPEVSDNSSTLSAGTKLPDLRPGWPLLRKAILPANIEPIKDGEAPRDMSVIQWVMNLPNRSVSSIQRSASINLTKELEIILGTDSTTCKLFQYDELRGSTNQFSSENLIGKGGNGQVYKGCLIDGQQVAIKISKLSEEASRDFLLEVDIITKIYHERIVPLMGICIENTEFISVYRYFSRGSLEENLHGKRAKTPLAWEKRFKVAIGVAEALNYLHNGCSRPVIHRDVKSSNILLSDEFEPQLSDFGLAILAPRTSSYQTNSDVVGTFGYLAPEYFMYGKVSDKIDVYAYGVVLLELLTGRKPISDDNPKGQESLVMWATPILLRGDLKELLDPNFDGKYDEDQMRRMVSVASLCITRAARLRPQMSQVLSLLRGEEEIESWMDCPNEPDFQDEEAYPASSVGSHLGLALLDVEDDASVISFEQSHLNSLDEYLRGRWSRSSSFD